jgi:hypothetical protein
MLFDVLEILEFILVVFTVYFDFVYLFIQDQMDNIELLVTVIEC